MNQKLEEVNKILNTILVLEDFKEMDIKDEIKTMAEDMISELEKFLMSCQLEMDGKLDVEYKKVMKIIGNFNKAFEV